jgi:hypothetical protein
MACSVVLSDSMVSVLAPPSVSEKLIRFAMATFTEQCSLLKKCRNPDCEFTIKMASLFDQDISCKACDFLNCAKPGCWEESHFPTSCLHVKEWEDMCKGDGGLMVYLREQRKLAGHGTNTGASLLTV